MTKKKEDSYFITCIALIFAGAVGNLIDSAFYGVLFSDSGYDIARFNARGRWIFFFLAW
jgi:signal peptidase II